MNKKQIIYIIFSVLWMSVIFMFSNKNANSSDNSSKGLIYNVVSIYAKTFNKNIDKEELVNKLNHPVRKLAHFTLYFILGFFVYHVFLYSKYKWKNIPTFIVCFLYSISDEVHQMFIPGRAGQVKDVLIDSSGVLAILLIIYIFNKLKYKEIK